MREPPSGGLSRHVLFLDRNLGHEAVAAALRARGATVEEHDDHFPIDAPDETWLPAIGQRGWAVITQDHRMRYRNAEKVAARHAGVALFIFVGRRMRGNDIGQSLARALPRMIHLLDTEQRPFIAKVTRSGDVELVP